MDRADLIVCDNVATARQAGELQHASRAIQDRAIAWPELAGAEPVPRSPGAITVADLCGIGAEDAAIAAAALTTIDLAKRSGTWRA